MTTSPLNAIKINVGEYETLSFEEKYIFLAEMLDRSVNGSLRQGINRFEEQLKPLGLSGDFNNLKRRDLFELQQIRNIIVHKRGIADRRFVEACPWLGIEIGKHVIVTHGQYVKFSSAAIEYATELLCRILEHFKVEKVREKLKKYQDKISKMNKAKTRNIR